MRLILRSRSMLISTIKCILFNLLYIKWLGITFCNMFDLLLRLLNLIINWNDRIHLLLYIILTSAFRHVELLLCVCHLFYNVNFSCTSWVLYCTILVYLWLSYYLSSLLFRNRSISRYLISDNLIFINIR